MDDEYDPLAHLSTALSLLPCTLAGVGFSLPDALSEMDQVKRFLDHMHEVLQKDQNPATKSLKKGSGPNPNATEKEGGEAGKKCSEGQKQNLKLASLESMKMEPKSFTDCHAYELSPNLESLKVEGDETGNSTLEGQNRAFTFKTVEPMQMEKEPSPRSEKGKTGSNPGNIDEHETGKSSFQGDEQYVNLVSSEPTQLEQRPCTNSCANDWSPNSDRLEIKKLETSNGSQGQHLDFSFKPVESMQMEKQPSTRSEKGKTGSNPDNQDEHETGKFSFQVQEQDVNFLFLEPTQLERRPCTNSCANDLSPNPDRLEIKKLETRNSSQGQDLDFSFKPVESMQMEKEPSTRSDKGKTGSNPDNIDELENEKSSFQGHEQDVNLASLEPTQLEQRPCTNSCANDLSPNPDRLEIKKLETRNSSQGQDLDFSFKPVESMEMEQQPSIITDVDKLRPNPDSMEPEKDGAGKVSSEGQNNLNFISVEPMLEQRPSNSSNSHNLSQNPDKMKIERDISGKNSSCPEGMVENGKKPRRPGLGLVYNISPFTPIKKHKKTKQVLPVDFTVLDHISDPDAFTKKAYELEAAVKAIGMMGGEPKIIGERVFKPVDDNQPKKRRPGLGIEFERPKFIPLPMRPLPAKVPRACPCARHNRAPTQSTNSPATTKVKDLSESQTGDPLSIPNATKEASEMNLPFSSSMERLLSALENCPEDDEEKAVAMVFECLNLKPTGIPPLVIPEMPKSRLHVVGSPGRQLPSIERVREPRGEDPLVDLQELKRKIFARSPTSNYSDDEVPEIGSDARGGNISDDEFADNDIPDEPEMDSTWENSPVNIEMPLDNSPVNSEVHISDDDFAEYDIPDEPEMDSPWENSPDNIEMSLGYLPVNSEVPPSDMPLENQPQEEVVSKDATGKKRGLDHADSSLDMNSGNPPPFSDDNTEIQAETSLVEPPRESDEQMAPPKKRKKTERKSKSSIQIEGGLQEVNGVRRSTRFRCRPLRHWMGERILYGSVDDKFPGAVGVRECSPATVGVRVKVKSFVSEEHADLVEWLAK